MLLCFFVCSHKGKNFCFKVVNKRNKLFPLWLLTTESDRFVVGKTKIHYFCLVINCNKGDMANDFDEKNFDGQMVLRTENLVKRYGKRTVVNNVSFNVKQGEIVGLLGPNGAGKTTSFYMTTGLVVPNDGHIFLNDEEITNFPVYKRARAGIGYLAQEASVFRKMTVEDNIASVLELTGKPKEYQKEKLESLIEEFRLQKVRKNLGDRLSGGERRRTEIARCLDSIFWAEVGCGH